MSELSRLRGSEEYVACSDEVMAHRPTGSTQTDRIRLPYAARRLSLSRRGGPGIGKGGKGKTLAFCQGLKGQARITARISRISRHRFM